ncbi:ATP-binding protein [Actomonas aquatica]|uniref:histidine kinase n=1 Tax=Actomonas aquatica TaxID=2866162 RepID=A0ABZ1CAZ5_9BACT|nr:ATP-binding protein [Opitutus sp. WL0086]WRQ88856.1 ATP-binding protein [Opitutus sp. WL0086]
MERYESIVENAVEGIFQSTPDGRFLLVNPALARLYGYDSPASLVQSIDDISRSVYADPSVREEFVRLMEQKGEVRGMEYQVQRKDGSLIWISEHARVVRDPKTSKLLYFEGFIEDITERKQIEAQLRQAQKMDAIGRLAGGVAHDFNNILTALVGYSEILRTLVPEGPAKTYLDAMMDGSQRAAALCRQLLILSRRHAVLPQVLDLNRVVQDMQKLLGRLITENIVLETSLADETLSIRADATQIEQVILNLVVNARDAMPNGGLLGISTRRIQIPDADTPPMIGLADGDYVEVAVRDNGTGMSAEVQSKLFEPFFTTKSEGKGTGLGLATCYNIIQQNRGQILVGSELGQGTTVRFFLPLVPEAPPSRHPFVDGGGGPTGDETVLVVEDDGTIRNLTSIVLEGLGYRVLTAENGAQGLEMAKQFGCRQIDLLVADVIMPQMDGRELAYWLRLVAPEMKVLFISGYTDRAAFSTGTLGKGMGFMQKPFGPAALSRRVREILDEPVA